MRRVPALLRRLLSKVLVSRGAASFLLCLGDAARGFFPLRGRKITVNSLLDPDWDRETSVGCTGEKKLSSSRQSLSEPAGVRGVWPAELKSGSARTCGFGGHSTDGVRTLTWSDGSGDGWETHEEES